MKTCTPENQIPILYEERRGSLIVLMLRCANYLEFKRLPDSVQYHNQVFGKTGWNSDRGVAYFRNDVKLVSAL